MTIVSAAPGSMTATAADYTWFDERLPGLAEAYCFTLIRGLTPVEPYGVRIPLGVSGLLRAVQCEEDHAGEHPSALTLPGELGMELVEPIGGYPLVAYVAGLGHPTEQSRRWPHGDPEEGFTAHHRRRHHIPLARPS
ncbi:DUF6461 domain-containing protein [Streptosporangium subroseum]|uniref:DUF6461 domain-containing protein n=1 Tax=Streptosporangium subroseum TaxID=106412 RepID=UPI00309114CA|nr:DUF6461 domain-containing protein [Streptosporangium subroseum]